MPECSLEEGVGAGDQCREDAWLNTDGADLLLRFNAIFQGNKIPNFLK